MIIIFLAVPARSVQHLRVRGRADRQRDRRRHLGRHGLRRREEAAQVPGAVAHHGPDGHHRQRRLPHPLLRLPAHQVRPDALLRRSLPGTRDVVVDSVQYPCVPPGETSSPFFPQRVN